MGELGLGAAALSWLVLCSKSGWEEAGGWGEIWSSVFSWLLLIFSQEHLLPGYLAWREGVERIMSCHPMTPAGQLTTPLWLKFKQITQLPVIKHLGGSSPPWWPLGQRSQHVLDPPSSGPSIPTPSVSASPQRNLGISLVENKQTNKQPPTRHKDQCRYSHPIFKAVRLRPEDVRDWKTRVFFKSF